MGHGALSLPGRDPLARQRGWFCLGGARWLPASVVRSREMALMSLAFSPRDPPPGSSRSSSLGAPLAGSRGWFCISPGAMNTPSAAPTAMLSLFAAVKGLILANGPLSVSFTGVCCGERGSMCAPGTCLARAGACPSSEPAPVSSPASPAGTPGAGEHQSGCSELATGPGVAAARPPARRLPSLPGLSSGAGLIGSGGTSSGFP